MGTFVLVHGAWQGASTWDFVTTGLQQAGHRVLTPTLRGLGVLQHLMDPSINLDSHIADVEAALAYEKVTDVVLVAHSYGGMVITGVADRVASRVKALVYIEAFVPEDGRSAMSYFPPPVQQEFRNQAKAMGDGWRLPAGEPLLDLWGVREEKDRSFVRSKLCDFSIRCFEQTISLSNAPRVDTRIYVRSGKVDYDYPSKNGFAEFHAKAQNEGWPCCELSAGHPCHVEKAKEVVDILLSAI